MFLLCKIAYDVGNVLKGHGSCLLPAGRLGTAENNAETVRLHKKPKESFRQVYM
jgi:hypothetical protein